MTPFFFFTFFLHHNNAGAGDLKTSNLLLSHQGVLKIADFGMAREYGSPLKPYTNLVVTQWYRGPELFLGEKLYSTSLDMWFACLYVIASIFFLTGISCQVCGLHFLRILHPKAALSGQNRD